MGGSNNLPLEPTAGLSGEARAGAGAAGALWVELSELILRPQLG